jgi:hypothetical protein
LVPDEERRLVVVIRDWDPVRVEEWVPDEERRLVVVIRDWDPVRVEECNRGTKEARCRYSVDFLNAVLEISLKHDMKS